jgi:DNA-binding response OmpR family regulator
MNIVMAMNMGADDFIAKPVDPMVMNAKIQAILRRTYDLAGKVPVIEHKGVVLNLNDGVAFYQGQQVELTKNEFRIFRVLMENRGKVVSRDLLMTRLWQDDCYVEENTLTVNVTRLRKKLESMGVTDLIQTKVGSGYIIG